MKVEAMATSSSKLSVGATAAPIMETPVAEAPVVETPGAETPAAETPAAPSDTPAPMKTGGAGDGQSWAEHMEADMEEEFQQDRPVKHCWSQSKKREPRPMLPFPLQDSEGRLRERISYYESHLRKDPLGDDTPDDDGLFSHGAQARMATAPGVDDAPSESATAQASDLPPTEGQTHAMEVDDKGTHSHSASPVSTAEDNLLMGGGAIGVELDLAHLTVSSPRSPNGEGKEASA